MSSPTTCLLFGSVVSTVGIIFVAFHVYARYQKPQNCSLTETESRFRDHQYARRMQTSALAITLGALIGLFGYLQILEDSPVFATCYVTALLLLSLWLVLLGLSDAIASRIHAGRQIRETDREHRSLQQALADVRRAYGLDR